MLGALLVALATVWILLLLVAFADWILFLLVASATKDHEPPRYTWRF
jgi:hypothetical protein